MESIEIIVQEHRAKKAGLHYDIRLVHPSNPNKVYSFVTRRKDIFPRIHNQKFFWPITQVHNLDSAQFEGVIDEGYGAGDVQVVGRFKANTDFYTELAGNGGELPTKFNLEVPREGVYTLVKRLWNGSEGYLIIKTVEKNSIHAPTLKKLPYKSMDPQSPQAIKLFKSDNVGFMEKKDGAGVRVLVSGGKLTIASDKKSVTGEPIIENPKVPHLDQLTLQNANKFEGLLLRGELYNDDVPKTETFRTTTSVLLSSPDRAAALQKEKGNLKLGLFGILGRQDKHTKETHPIEFKTYLDEQAELKNIVSNINSKDIEVLEVTKDYQKKLELFRKAGEGVIAVYPDLPLSKVNPFIKLKKRSDINLEIVGVTEGTGRRAGSLGSLILTDRSKQANIMVSSGIDDTLAKDIYKNFHKYKGKVVKVKYYPGFGDGGLRGPVFLGFEEEGTLPDYKYK